MNKLSIDPDEMTIGDLEDFQSLTGVSLDSAFSPKQVYEDDGSKSLDARGRPVKAVNITPTVLKVLIYIEQRRTNPEFTLEDARKVKVKELEIGAASEVDPQ